MIHPHVNNCNIPAELQEYVIQGEFHTKNSYQVSFIIDENGYRGSNAWNGNFESEPDPTCKYITFQ